MGNGVAKLTTVCIMIADWETDTVFFSNLLESRHPALSTLF